MCNVNRTGVYWTKLFGNRLYCRSPTCICNTAKTSVIVLNPRYWTNTIPPDQKKQISTMATNAPWRHKYPWHQQPRDWSYGTNTPCLSGGRISTIYIFYISLNQPSTLRVNHHIFVIISSLQCPSDCGTLVQIDTNIGYNQYWSYHTQPSGHPWYQCQDLLGDTQIVVSYRWNWV